MYRYEEDDLDFLGWLVWTVLRVVAALMLVVLAVVCFPVRAQFYSGNELIQRMQSESVVDKMVALGFVAGVADAWDGILVCPPENSTTGQTRDIALKFLILNPAKRHRPAAELVSEALGEAWPCVRKPGKGGSKL